MASLTLTTKTVKDGSGASITTQLYSDPNHSDALGPVTALVCADGTIFALGQALAAASVPVVLTAAQLATLAAPVLGAGANNIGTVELSATALAALESLTTVTTVSTVTAVTAITNAVTIAANAYTSQPTVTRPANQTAYAAGDVVGGAITFTNAGPSGGYVLITNADLRINVAAIPSGMTTFRLHLYDVTPPSALADNAAWDLPSGDRASYLGYIDLGTVADLGSTLYVQTTTPNKNVKLNASTSLFGYLVTAGGFTPAGTSEVYVPRLQGAGL